MAKYYEEAYPVIQESFRKFFEEGQAAGDALRDLWIEDWMKRNPGQGRGTAMRAYENREGTVKNPAKFRKPEFR
jgi:hypothetical protein